MGATPASQWKGKINTDGSDVELPSGNVALVRQLSPTAFLESGMLPDPLSAVVHKAIHDGKGLNPKQLQRVMADPKQVTAALELFDRVLAYVVIEPDISMPPTCTECGEYANKPQHSGQADGHRYREGEREEGVLYADQVVMDDKVYIFNWCLGNTIALKEFREQQEGTMESLQNGQDLQVQAE